MRTIITLSAALLLFHTGCGGAEPEAEDDANGDFTAGGDDAMGEERITEPPSEVSVAPEPVPSGPVSVTVTLKIGSEEVPGNVALVNEAGETVAEGSAGQSFTVPSGNYQITGSITEASVLIDTPTVTQETELPPGEPQAVEIVFPRARVLLNVSRGGRALRRPEVTLYRQGSEEPAATFQVGSEHVPISPGRYEADVKLRGHEIRVRGLTFMDGATQSIPVNIE